MEQHQQQTNQTPPPDFSDVLRAAMAGAAGQQHAPQPRAGQDDFAPALDEVRRRSAEVAQQAAAREQEEQRRREELSIQERENRLDWERAFRNEAHQRVMENMQNSQAAGVWHEVHRLKRERLKRNAIGFAVGGGIAFLGVMAIGWLLAPPKAAQPQPAATRSPHNEPR